jgi:hypothetical protein
MALILSAASLLAVATIVAGREFWPVDGVTIR